MTIEIGKSLTNIPYIPPSANTDTKVTNNAMNKVANIDNEIAMNFRKFKDVCMTKKV